jgi:glucose 1-dehydrogenase
MPQAGPGVQLDGKVAVITGAGRGMGAATAELFAAAGAHVMVSDVDVESGQRVTEAIRAAGGDAQFQRCDISQSAEVEALVAATVDAFGRLDCAVNNAGVSPDTRMMAELDEQDFDRVITVNLKGTALCLRSELAQVLRQGDGGSIVNISSVSGFRPQPANAGYNAAKHGVLGLTKTASLEYAPLGIRVNAVCPGAIDTKMLRDAVETIGSTEAEIAPVLSLFGRFGRPDEVAQASLWLCSDYASFVTGASLLVDAGYTSR